MSSDCVTRVCEWIDASIQAGERRCGSDKSDAQLYHIAECIKRFQRLKIASFKFPLRAPLDLNRSTDAAIFAELKEQVCRLPGLCKCRFLWTTSSRRIEGIAFAFHANEFPKSVPGLHEQLDILQERPKRP